MTLDPTSTVRPATARDWAEIDRLLRVRALPTDGARKHQAGFLVAADGSSVTGCIGLERYGSVGLLRSLAVTEQSSGRGVGTALVRALLTRARALEIETLYLLTTTAADFFPRFGFEPVPRTALPASLSASEELRGACPASAVAMRLTLPGQEAVGDRAGSSA
jgi:amino-acid N-acetyltransferase